MKLHHFSTILKGIFFSFIVLTIAVSCSKEEEEPPTAEFTFSPISPKVNEEVTFSNSSTNATSYQWSAAGTSFSSTAQNPKFTFTTAGDFNVKLVATGAGGTTEIIKKVTVLALPVAGFSFSPTSPKTGEEVTFTNTSTDATSYQWSVAGTSLTSTSQNPKFIFSTAGDFDVKLIATGPGGTTEIIKKVTVLALPVAGFSFSPTSPKTGEEVTFTNTSTDATSYQWSAAGTSFSSTAQNPKFTFTAAGDFDVKLIATGPGGTSEITKKVTVTAVQPAPVAGFSFSPASPKTGEEVTFTSTSTNATSYQWSAAGTSFSSTAQNPKFTFTTAGNYNVKLVVTNATGTNEITKQVTVTAALTAPVANFNFSPTSPKTGEEVTFTSTSTNATSYQWSAAGTSFSSTAQNPKFTFTTAGNYNVKLVVTNATGTNEITKQVTVTAALPAPVANFNFAPTSPKTGEEVTFTSTSTNATSYQWSAAGTSFSSTAQNPKFTFTTAGNYNVKLVVTNATGTNEITKQVTVTAALPAPVANFNFAPTSPKTGEEVTFTSTSTNATSYQWSAAGTSFSSTAQNPKFTFTTAGNYTVKLVVTNATGTNEITKQVTVTAESGGNSNPCNLPDCYVQKTTTVSTGVTTTITYGYTTVNGKKMIASIDTSTGFGNVVVSIQYDAQGRRIKDESRVGGTLQNSIEYSYSNGDKTVRANTYDAGGTLTSYTISTYDTSMRLTRTDNYTAAGVLTGYTVYSNFLNITGSFPQLVQTYNASNAITQTDVHTYQDCQLKSTVSKDGSGTVIGEVTNTIDAQKLLRTSVATIITFGFNITSTTQYVYDCD